MNGKAGKRSKLLAAFWAFILMVNCSNGVITVEPGERIQAAIDSATSGETIEVYGGVYKESIIVDRSIVLKGIGSESGLPRVECESGSAITIRADGVVLDGFWAKSISGWTGDAGILVLSNDNIIQNNMVSGSGNAGILLQEAGNNTISGNVVQANGREGLLLKNSTGNFLLENEIADNRYGLKLVGSGSNRIMANRFLDNEIEAVNLKESHANIIERNYARGSEGALVADGSRDNIVKGNDFVGNQKGIYLSYIDANSGIQPAGTGVVISYNSMPSEDLVSSNNSIYLNNLSNEKNARDDGLNNWDNGKMGNNYSDFNDPDEGCEGGKICNSELSIPGGPSVDRYPQAAPVIIPGRITGQGGAAMHISGKSYPPGEAMYLNYSAPSGREAWLSLADGRGGLHDNISLGRNISGDLRLVAPQVEGSFSLVMLDENRGMLLELPFNVTVPAISAGPQTVFTCEKVIVDFIGASGRAGDWIGMYQNDSGSLVSRQMLGSRESGNITFSNPDPGSYFFNMHFEGDESVKASSGGVEVRENFGKKMTAEPSHVQPGGQVTVTYWGAPPSGTGVVGMYGMTRPDKFDLGKRPVGSRSCGSMVWTLPTTPGTYDFRLFEDDINRNLLAQSNSVTVS